MELSIGRKVNEALLHYVVLLWSKSSSVLWQYLLTTPQGGSVCPLQFLEVKAEITHEGLALKVGEGSIAATNSYRYMAYFF